MALVLLRSVGHGRVPGLRAAHHLVRVQFQVAGGPAERHLVLADVVAAGKVADHAARRRDAHVADAREQPTERRSGTHALNTHEIIGIGVQTMQKGKRCRSGSTSSRAIMSASLLSAENEQSKAKLLPSHLFNKNLQKLLEKVALTTCNVLILSRPPFFLNLSTQFVKFLLVEGLAAEGGRSVGAGQTLRVVRAPVGEGVHLRAGAPDAAVRLVHHRAVRAEPMAALVVPRNAEDGQRSAQHAAVKWRGL